MGIQPTGDVMVRPRFSHTARRKGGKTHAPRKIPATCDVTNQRLNRENVVCVPGRESKINIEVLNCQHFTLKFKKYMYK